MHKSYSKGWIWVGLAAVLGCTRLFEEGISLDPSLYASIARDFSRHWNFWSLKASANLFPEYYEHPFLLNWLQGGIFATFGVSDWATRLLGFFLGSFSFYYVYQIGLSLKDQAFAHLLCFLTLLSIHYVGMMPTFYLEVPMTFFMLGALSYFLKAIKEANLKNELLAGLFLGLAFLCKGLAALPMLAALGLVALYYKRQNIFINRASYLTIAVWGIVVFLFCFLQNRYGAYSFFDNYYQDTFMNRTLKPGIDIGPWLFVKKFFEYHAAHLFLAFFSFWIVYKNRLLAEPFLIGLLCTTSFVIANASLGFPFRHYYFPIYPIINILSACALYPFLKNHSARLIRIGTVLALGFLIFWQICPLPMRKKAPDDFYALRAPFKRLKAESVHTLTALGISKDDWIYRQFSLWYWDIDSRMQENNMTHLEPVLISSRKFNSALLKQKNYKICAASKQYFVWTNQSNLFKQCEGIFND